MPISLLFRSRRGLLALALSGGCAVGAPTAAPLPAVPATNSGTAPPASSARVLTLTSAWRLALAYDPTLRGAALLDVAAAGEIEHAGVRPVPTLSVELENVAGTGARRGLDSVELTLSVAQVFEHAAKRAQRVVVAERSAARVAQARELRRAELEGEVQQRFLAVAVAQRWVELRREQVALAEASATETVRRGEAGRGSAVDAARAQLAVRQQEFGLRQAERAVQAARERLAVLWGEVPVQPFGVEATLDTAKVPEPVPSLAELLPRLPQTAALARFGVERAERDALVAWEDVRLRPDLEVVGGVRYFNDDGGDAALLLGVQWPWPAGDRNAGQQRAARARRELLEHERDAAAGALLDQLSEAHGQARDARADLADLADELLPAAEATLAATVDGYARGQLALLAVLESRAACFAIREAQLDALARYTTALARLETLTRPQPVVR